MTGTPWLDLPEAAADDPGLRARQHEVLADFELLDLPADAELEAVTRVAAAVTGTRCATVNLLEDSRMRQLATVGVDGGTSPRGESVCDQVTRWGGVFASPDLSQDPRFRGSAWVDGRWASVRLYASAPLVLSGTVVGTLCVFDDSPGDLTPDQLLRLADLADVVVALLERRRAHRAAEAATAELRRTRAFDQALLEALPVGVVAADADRRITLFNQVSRRWHGAPADGGLSPDELPQAYDLFDADGSTPLTPERIPLLRVYEEGPLTGAEIVIHPHDSAPRRVSVSGTPILAADGELLGAVVAMEDVTAQRELESRLREAAGHDHLTGLPNRGQLVARLDQALAESPSDTGGLALLYCDLDGFKAVNDDHGHAVGDEVLAAAALRLRGALRPGDVVGRMGGDEFVLLCTGLTDPAGAHVIAERVARAFDEPFPSSVGPLMLGISTGVAVRGADSTSQGLLALADSAMYRSKGAHRRSAEGRR